MFTGWDYAVFLFMLGVSLGIGVFHGFRGRKKTTTKEFLMAGGQMGVLPVSLSLLASFMSAIMVLGTPAEMYVYGTQYWMVCLGYAIMIPLSAHFFLPVFYRLNLTSVFEYLEMRFDKGIRMFVYVMYIIQTLMYMAIVLYTPALALNIVQDGSGTVLLDFVRVGYFIPLNGPLNGHPHMTGLNVWFCVLTVGIVCTIYTALGGMKATMWADVFQICTMFAGLFAVMGQGLYDHGGFGNLWKAMHDTDRIEFFNVSLDPEERHTMWSLSFGACFVWLSIYGVNQAQVQRALCTSNLRTGQMALWVNLPGLTLLMTLTCVVGFIIVAEYEDCDPLSTMDITRDQLLPLYVVQRLNVPCLPGLFTASVFSGALSSISGGLNSLAAVTLQDVVRHFWFPNMTEHRATIVSKCIAVGYGLFMMLLTYIASLLGGVLQAALGLFGMIGGPTLGLYILGMLFPWSNTKGAYAGFISGMVATMWMGFGAYIYKPNIPRAPVSTAGCDVINSTTWSMSTSSMYDAPTALPDPADAPGYLGFYRTSYMWYGLFAVIVTNTVGLIVSFVTGPNKPKDVDPRLLAPYFDIFCCCLPSKLRNILQCHIEYPDDVDESIDDKRKNEMEIPEITTTQDNGRKSSA